MDSELVDFGNKFESISLRISVQNPSNSPSIFFLKDYIWPKFLEPLDSSLYSMLDMALQAVLREPIEFL